MNDGGAAWSGLGSSMNLPSAMKEEMDNLKLELRDLKLAVSKDLMELRTTVDSVIGDMVSLIERQKSLLTRVEGLETRAQNGLPVVGSSDPFNAFAYVDISEIEGSTKEIEEVQSTANIEVEPDGSNSSDELEADKDDGGVRVFSDEDLAATFLELVGEHIDEVGGILNNVLFSKLWRREEEVTPKIKKLVKAGLESDETLSLHKLSKLRGLYYRKGGDPDAIYNEVYG
jgi:hypothetical protein